MSATDRNCVISQAIDEVLAIDHAKYDGQKALIYFYKDSNNLEIKVVDSSCDLLANLK